MCAAKLTQSHQNVFEWTFHPGFSLHKRCDDNLLCSGSTHMCGALTALSRGSWLSSPPMLMADIEVVSSLSTPSWTASSWFLLFPFFFFSTGAAPGSLWGQEFWWVTRRSSSLQQRFLAARLETLLLPEGLWRLVEERLSAPHSLC